MMMIMVIGTGQGHSPRGPWGNAESSGGVCRPRSRPHVEQSPAWLCSCAFLGPWAPPSDQLPPGTQALIWTFLSARSGRFLDESEREE